MTSILGAIFRTVSGMPQLAPAPAGKENEARAEGRQRSVSAQAPVTTSGQAFVPDTNAQPRSASGSTLNTAVASNPSPAAYNKASHSAMDIDQTQYNPDQHTRISDQSLNTSYDTSYEHDVVIHQDTPYVYRNHRNNQHAFAPSSPAVIETLSRPKRAIPIRSPLADISGELRFSSTPLRKVPAEDHPRAEEGGKHQENDGYEVVPKWKIEQRRKMNPPRIIQPVVQRKIPAQHGQANLPYARNPSGVDSAIQEEAPYVVNTSANALDLMLKASYEPIAPGKTSYSGPYTGKNEGATQAVPTTQPVAKEARQPQAAAGVISQGTGQLVAPALKPAALPTVSPLVPAEENHRPREDRLIDQHQPIGTTHLAPSDLLRAQIAQAKKAHSAAVPILPAPTPQSAKPATVDDPFFPLFQNALVPANAAQQVIVDDVRSYQQDARFIVAADPAIASSALTAGKIEAQGDAGKYKPPGARQASANNNWRYKTPAKTPVSAPIAPPPTLEQTPASDSSGHASIMTIDSLFEKFAGGNSLSPAVKVNPPTADDLPEPAAFVTPAINRNLLRPASPDVQSPALFKAGAVASGKSATAPTDENSVPSRAAPRTPKIKGTPGAGKHLKKAAAKADAENTPPVPTAKEPLVKAKTVPGKAKNKAARKA